MFWCFVRIKMFIYNYWPRCSDVYKSIRQLNSVYLQDLVVITRNSLPIEQPIYKTVRHGFKSVIYQGLRYWNILHHSMSAKMIIE